MTRVGYSGPRPCRLWTRPCRKRRSREFDQQKRVTCEFLRLDVWWRHRSVRAYAQVSQYTFAMCSYRERKADPTEIQQLDGFTVDYCEQSLMEGRSSLNYCNYLRFLQWIRLRWHTRVHAITKAVAIYDFFYRHHPTMSAKALIIEAVPVSRSSVRPSVCSSVRPVKYCYHNYLNFDETDRKY